MSVLCAVCERNIDDDRGTVQSPNFPDIYPEDTTCTYRFGNHYYGTAGYPTGQPGYRYVLHFTSFDLEQAVNGTCVNDYVEVGFVVRDIDIEFQMHIILSETAIAC